MNVKSDVSTNWKMFKEAWCYYITATELSKKPKEVQAGALCSVMGMDCVKVMSSLTTLTASDKKDPEKILSALSDHFMPQIHLLFERVKFGFANQAENERIDQYVVRLRQLFFFFFISHTQTITIHYISNSLQVTVIVYKKKK